MSALFMAVGTCRMGHTTRDGAGNVVEHTDPSFTPDPNGGSVIVGRIKFTDDAMEQDGPAEIFGDWDAAGYLGHVMEVLQPTRRPNIPDIKAIVLDMVKGHFDTDCPFMDHCQSVNCRDCIITQWIEEMKEEAETC